MTLVSGIRIGPYEIVGVVGAGGMGKVYKASDMNLKRSVAIKVLPESLATDRDRIARFQREAEVLASLNHTNIAAIYGLERSDGITALVMELVEGPTLADRIAPGPIPVDEALPIAKQIAEALEVAHEQGIIHRDLKPANIKVRPDGTVKVLDFGLAKALEPKTARGDATASPTITSPAMMTGVGVLLGTAAYMSPEQARGKPVDKRTDIWAFGCVFFEMLTGKRAFHGEDVAEILGAVIHKEPAWSELPADTPGWLRTLLRRCLQKDPKKRLPHIGLARIEIEEAPSISDASVSTPTAFESARLRRKARLAWSLVGITSVALLAVVIPAVRHVRETPRPPSPPETRLEIVTPSTTDPTSLSISPDGRQIVFVASGDGQSRLWLRPLASASARPLEGTEGASYPFWSPDSKSIGFFADAKLKRLDIGGGVPQSLTDLSGSGFGGAWNANGAILFSSSVIGPLQRISASGGEAVRFTTLDRQISHRFPQFLPDGRQFLFYARGTSETQGIYLGSLDAKNIKRLTVAETAGVYVPAGWLLWVRGTALVAQRLDLERQELVGDQISVADPVAVEAPLGVAAVSVSADGLIAYRTGGTSRRQLVWFNRAGKALGAFGIADEATLSWPRISPDGRRVTVNRMVQGNQDLWLLDGVRETRFTFDAALDRHPVWSPDGNRIVFDSNRNGSQHLYIKGFGGIASEELLVELQFPAVPSSWSADGRYLLYVTVENSGFDLWVLPMQGDKKPWPFLKTNFNEGDGEFSPDGRWVAYDSDQSGRAEVYVRPFEERATANQTVGQWQVSTAGGMQPRWAANGNELYYVAPGGRLMAVPITAVAATFQAGAPTQLFAAPMVGGGTNAEFGRQYDVTRDGRFLINTMLNAPSPPITIVQNWTAN